MNESCNTVKIAEQETGDTLEELYTYQIFRCIDEFCEKAAIDDLSAISQSKWNSLLLYVNKTLFENTNTLKRKPYTDYRREEGARKNFHAGNNNAFDFDRVREVEKIYIYCCFLYEKECSVFGFSLMTGISRETLYTWKNDPCSGGSDIVKNIIASREETLSDKLFSAKTNPVGTIAILNHAYKWNTNGATLEIKSASQSLEEIEKKYAIPDSEQEQAETETMPGGDQETDTGRLSFD